jgi:hypothetical protein
VAPVLSTYNFLDCRFSNAKLSRQRSCRVSLVRTRPYKTHFFFCELCTALAFSSGDPFWKTFHCCAYVGIVMALGITIVVILGARANKEMVWIDTRRSIAGMADTEIVRQKFKRKEKSQSVCKIPLALKLNFPIALYIPMSMPEPTRWGLLYVFPKVSGALHANIVTMSSQSAGLHIYVCTPAIDCRSVIHPSCVSLTTPVSVLSSAKITIPCGHWVVGPLAKVKSGKPGDLRIEKKG